MSKSYTFAAPIESVDELAELVDHRTVLYHRTNRNADGTPQRWRVNGTLKRWKRNHDRIRLPLAHGLYDHYTIYNLDQFNDHLATSYEPV